MTRLCNGIFGVLVLNTGVAGGLDQKNRRRLKASFFYFRIAYNVSGMLIVSVVHTGPLRF